MLNLPKPSLGQIATGSGDSEYPDLWRGLIMACDAGINDRTDRWTDWSGKGNHFTLSNVTRVGDGLVFNGSNSSAATVGAVKYNSTTQLTIVCDHAPAYLTTAKIMLESSVNYNTSTQTFLLYREDVNNFTISHHVSSSGYCEVRYAPVDRRHVASYIMDRTVNGSPDMMRLVNGNYIPYLSYPSTGESNVGLNDYILYLGARGGSSLYWPGTFHKLYIWTRLLSAQEHYQLSMGASPLQKRRRLWLFVRSGTTLTPISLTIRASSSASGCSGVLHGGLIAGRSNTVSRLLSTPISGHLLNARASSESTAQAQPKRTASLTGKADSATTAMAQAVKATKLAGQVASESSETANITKSVPLASIAGRTATASSQSMGVIGGHRVAAKTSTATDALAYVRIILPSISAGDCEFEISYDVSGLAVSPESATLTATEEGTVLTLEVSKMKTGDTLGYVNMTLTRNGSAFNPSGYSLTVIGKIGSKIKVRKQPEIVDASTGRVRFRFDASEIDAPGTMQFEVYAKDTSTTPNRVLTISSTGYPSITIEPALGVPL